ncbi:hypothetical protein ACTJJY_23815 [Bacillus sp. 22475]|uniref:hypothetical protein n=1 Tax=Bacillus sp. 22475 TaxID=3453925 RepID=UPI003F862FD9
MQKKVALALALASCISLGQAIPTSKVFAEENQSVIQNDKEVQKELQKSWDGNTTNPDKEKEIKLQPGETAPIPHWVKEVEKQDKSFKKFGLAATATETSFVNQLAYMSKRAYDTPSKDSFIEGGWQVYDTYSASNSLDVVVYRKKYIEDYDRGFYGYTFAFRGSQETLDFVIDVAQVAGNVGGLQAQSAVDYVKKIIDKDRPKMHHVYFTGHSLGGYLAQWVQSEMIDGTIISGPSYTMTFNAPGISTGINFLDPSYTAKAYKKIAKDKVSAYDGFIDNYRIENDKVSLWGDTLGKLYTYSAKGSGNPLYYHGINRFLELGL